MTVIFIIGVILSIIALVSYGKFVIEKKEIYKEISIFIALFNILIITISLLVQFTK